MTQNFTAPPTFAAPAAPQAPVAPKTAPVAPPVAPQAPTAAPQAAPVTPQAAPTVAPTAPVSAPEIAPQAPVEEKKKRTQVRKATKVIDLEDTKFVVQNVKTMDYKEIAEKRGLTKNQVNRILQSLKGGVDKAGINFGLRGAALTAGEASGEAAYGMKTNKDGLSKPDFSKPLSEMAQKVETKIANELSRPADARPGGSKGGGKAKQAIDNELENLLAGL